MGKRPYVTVRKNFLSSDNGRLSAQKTMYRAIRRHFSIVLVLLFELRLCFFFSEKKNRFNFA